MGKKMKKLIVGALIAGSIIGIGMTAYAYRICSRCEDGRIWTTMDCCKYHCSNCGCSN